MNQPDDAFETDRYLQWDAAYVLGALSPAERRDFERHKATCGRCTAAVEELAGMPALLATTPTSVVAELEELGGRRAPADSLGLVLRSARRHRARRRAVVVGLAAAAVIGISAGIAVPQLSSHPEPARVALNQVVASPLHADVRLVSESWGTRIDLRCSYDSYQPGDPFMPGTTHGYSMVVTDRAGKQQSAGSWWAGPGATVSTIGSVGVSVADIASITVTSATGATLLQLNR